MFLFYPIKLPQWHTIKSSVLILPNQTTTIAFHTKTVFFLFCTLTTLLAHQAKAGTFFNLVSTIKPNDKSWKAGVFFKPIKHVYRSMYVFVLTLANQTSSMRHRTKPVIIVFNFDQANQKTLMAHNKKKQTLFCLFFTLALSNTIMTYDTKPVIFILVWLIKQPQWHTKERHFFLLIKQPQWHIIEKQMCSFLANQTTKIAHNKIVDVFLFF